MTSYDLYDKVRNFLFREAELIDERKFDDWNQLFTADGVYWIPLDAGKDPKREWSLVYDTPLRRDERVYHLNEVPFASQRPESRTLHMVTNIRLASADHDQVLAVSNQIIYEIRVGDFRQVGLGEQRSFAARVEYELRAEGNEFRMAKKTVHLLNRGTPIGNLTFIL